MRMRFGWLLGMAMLALAPAAAAQTPATAEQTARAFLAALDGARWQQVAGMLAPAETQRQRDIALAIALAELEATRQGGSGVVRGSATVDSVLLRRHGAYPVRTLRGVSTLAQAAALEPREFMARMMEATTAGHPGAHANRRVHRYLGIVVENDSVAHALFRDEGGLVQDDSASVLELRRIGGRWYIDPGTPMFVRMPLLGPS